MMEGILFQRILSWVIWCYQHFQVFVAHINPLLFQRRFYFPDATADRLRSVIE